MWCNSNVALISNLNVVIFIHGCLTFAYRISAEIFIGRVFFFHSLHFFFYYLTITLTYKEIILYLCLRWFLKRNADEILDDKAAVTSFRPKVICLFLNLFIKKVIFFVSFGVDTIFHFSYI